MVAVGMTLTGLGIIPFKVLTAPRTTDEYGQDIANWANATETEVTGWFQPNRGSEVLIDRDEQRFEAVAWFPAGTPINGRDRVIIGEAMYEVIGPPERRLRPWASIEHHVRVALRMVTGPGEMSPQGDKLGNHGR